MFKLVGKVLVKQDIQESRLNVKKRIEFIGNEIKNSESLINTLQQDLEALKMKLVNTSA